MMTSQRQNFIDWMKAIGMLLIVAGHVVGDPYSAFNQIAQPAYTKQLGVAFFVFITGWGLAHVQKVTFYTLYSRLFSLMIYGLLFALFFTVLFYLTKGELQLSNYLPLMLGANVVFNNFPANPTTWYIGTYIHLLLVWFFWIRHCRIGKTALVMAFVIENISRITLLMADQAFIAYMLLPNWLTVFVLGQYLWQQQDQASAYRPLLIAIAWLSVAIIWSFTMSLIPVGEGFPLRHVMIEAPWAVLVQSLLISTIYLLSTWLFFQLARTLPANRLVQFLSRHTIVIFILHLPIIFAFHPTWYGWIGDTTGDIKRISLIVVVYVGCAIISALLQKVLQVERWRDPIWRLLRPVFVKLRLIREGETS